MGESRQQRQGQPTIERSTRCPNTACIVGFYYACLVARFGPFGANLTGPEGDFKLNQRRGRRPSTLIRTAILQGWKYVMNNRFFQLAHFQRFLCLALAGAMVASPSAAALGQGAVQAVRGRVAGLQSDPAGAAPAEAPPAAPEGAPTTPSLSSGPTAGKLDTTFVSANATMLVVLRPAQIMTSPVAQMLPIEAATAAGRQYLGVDPAEIDEVIMFGDAATQAYGIIFKFKNPFRATSIPQQFRMLAKLSELNGKKYLQSTHPIFPSFYGPNNKTLVVAPDAVMQQIVPASTQPKSGALIDRVREVPSGSDLYAAIDVASLRGAVPLFMGTMGKSLPPAAQQAVSILQPWLDQTAAMELTVNLVTRGPVAFVLHGNDEAAAQQLETMMTAVTDKVNAATPGEQPPEIDPFAQARTQYVERMKQRIRPQRNGTSVTWLRIESDDPLQPQLFGMVVGAALVGIGQSSTQPVPPSAVPPPSGPETAAAPGPGEIPAAPPN
jgi:hypothetical protein